MSRPSTQFIVRGAIAIGIVAIILVVQTTWFRALFHKGPVNVAPSTTTTVGDILTKDSNGNEIPDWEEKLWGLDPTVLYTNGVPNRQLIEEKKRSLGVSDSTTSQNMNETDQLSRELFTLATALGQSDEVDSATLDQIASTFGSSIDTDRVQNRYSIKDIQTVKTTSQSLTTYAAQVKKIITRYDTGQADIDVVITALETGDESSIPSLETTAATYRALATALVALPTPIGVAGYHLSIVNGIAGVADSFGLIKDLSDNGLGALVGVAIYRQYSLKLDTAIFDMAQYLTDYGILPS